MINFQYPMIKNEIITRKVYDLEERTAKFAESVIDCVKDIKKDSVNIGIISQIVKSAGSVGANYSEAVEAESRKDFIHKASISKKEIKETKHWLRLLVRANPECRILAKNIWKEAQELLLIFSKSISTARSNLK